MVDASAKAVIVVSLCNSDIKLFGIERTVVINNDFDLSEKVPSSSTRSKEVGEAASLKPCNSNW